MIYFYHDEELALFVGVQLVKRHKEMWKFDIMSRFREMSPNEDVSHQLLLIAADAYPRRLNRIGISLKETQIWNNIFL